MKLRAVRSGYLMPVVAILCAGCRLNGGGMVPCPLSHQGQQEQILALVPLGTPREAAMEKLAEAGIDGKFTGNSTVYYCDVWRRENGEQWLLDVAMLFDQSGELYKVRPAGWDVGAAASPVEAAETAAEPGSTSRQNDRVNSTPGAADAGQPIGGGSARNAARTPFADE